MTTSHHHSAPEHLLAVSDLTPSSFTASSTLRPR